MRKQRVEFKKPMWFQEEFGFQKKKTGCVGEEWTQKDVDYIPC